MKLDRWGTACIATVLAFLLAFGAMGCMITAFGLPLENYLAVVLAWGICALFCSVAFRWKRGGILVLFLAALLTGFLWRRGEAEQQFLQMLYRITYIYNKAYDCGVFKLVDTPWDAGVADLPMGIFGALIAMVTAWTVCRGESALYAIGLSFLPLLFCMVVTDTVPAPAYLFDLFFVWIILLLTTRVRKSDPYQGNRLTLLVALPTALALGGLFLAVPQEGYVNQSAEMRAAILNWVQELPESLGNSVQEAAINVQGSEPENVSLASMGRRIESTAPVMYVCADVGGTLYLRGQDYDVYSGTGWTASNHRVEDFSGGGIDLGSVTVQTQNELEQLYLPYYPKDGQSLIGGKLDNSRLYTQYTFSRNGLPDNWRELAATDSGNGVDVPRAEPDLSYLALPEQTRTRANTLLATILREETTITEKAETIANFVRNSARYDLNTSRMPNGEEDFALWFLEGSETGYCVHFATAAAVLLRAAGIEARYVSGYMVRAHAGETATVTGENAHAWAEYYEPALNTWLVLEATPADLNEPVEAAGALPETLPATEAASYPTEGTNHPTEIPDAPTQSSTPVQLPAESAAPKQMRDLGWLGSLLKLLLFLTASAAVIQGQRGARLGLRRRQQRTGSPNAQALARWQETELLARLLKEAPPQELEALAQKAKFSQHTLLPEEVACFEAYLRTARKRLRQKPWHLRMVHRYIFAIY